MQAVPVITFILLGFSLHAETVYPQQPLIPLFFEPNQGQTDPSIRYLSRGPGYKLSLTNTETQISVGNPAHPNTIHMQFPGARPFQQIAAEQTLPAHTNYFIGRDRSHWHTNVPAYSQIRIKDVYPGIDIRYYGNAQQLEYDFIVHPGADLNQIRLRFAGAGKLHIDSTGDLLIGINGAELRQKLPQVYQQNGAKTKPIHATYRLLASNEVAFHISTYDSHKQLIIDPVLTLTYSTYLGGSGSDQANGVAVDSSGNIWVAGQTQSTNFPQPAPIPAAPSGGIDAFVAKFNPSGSTLLYINYLGGSGDDIANGIAVDPAGNAYLTGSTTSPNFPLVNPLYNTNSGGMDAFVVKLSPTGAMLYSTYLGGSADDAGTGIAVDANGNAYIAGYTASPNFPTAAPQQPNNRGSKDAFIVRLSAAGDKLLYSTYLGGVSDDQANAIAVDSSGSAYVAGSTQSSDFPVVSAFQPKYGGHGNAFVTKLASNGIAVYSTYLGGGGVTGDAANGIAVDSTGNAYIVGYTSSIDFPVLNAFQPRHADPSNGNFAQPDAFITKLNAAGTALIFSTFLGGSTNGYFSALMSPSGYDAASGIALDSSGNAYVAGYSNSPDFPLLDPLQGYQYFPLQNASFIFFPGESFIAQFTSTGSLVYSSFLGGANGADKATSIALDASANPYLAGYTQSVSFPVVAPFQGNNAGGTDAFLSKLSFSTPGVRVFFASSPVSGSFTTSGSGCSPGTYNAPVPSVYAKGFFGTSAVFQQPASCQITVLPVAGTSPGTRYVFGSWVDGDTTNPRNIQTPAHSVEYQANLQLQNVLTTSISPAGSGSLLVSPGSSDGYYSPASIVTLSAVPNPGFSFSNFTGDLIGTVNGQTLTMSAPHSVTAVFNTCSYSVSPLGPLAASANQTPETFTVTTQPGCAWSASSNAPWLSGPSTGTGTGMITFTAATNRGPARSATLTLAGTSITLNQTTLGPDLPGFFRNGYLWVLATDNSYLSSGGSPTTYRTFPFGGLAGDIPIAGDWNGDGRTKAGVYRSAFGVFMLDYNGDGLFDPAVDKVYNLGVGTMPGDIPVAGDWNGNGRTKVGLFRQGYFWILDYNGNGIFDSGIDKAFAFGGAPGDVPVVGDWTGSGTSKVGLFRAGFYWVLDTNGNGQFDPGIDATFAFGGAPGDVPIVGDWNGDGRGKAGIFRAGYFWVLDANGNHLFDGTAAGQDLAFPFGGVPGDKPVVGKW